MDILEVAEEVMAGGTHLKAAASTELQPTVICRNQNFFCRTLFIYMRERGRERERERECMSRGEGQREREADPLLSRKPDLRLDSRTLGSLPELKADD